jgi:glutamate-1-semialdehyde 2,1-aminomutase
LLTPFHNMALMCPDTTAMDIDQHTKIFAEAAAELAEWGNGILKQQQD